MSPIFDTFTALATQQQAKSRDEFVRYESRLIAREVNAEIASSDAAIERISAAIRRGEELLAEMEHYTNHVFGRPPQ